MAKAAKVKSIKVSEKQIHKAICQYLKVQYPNLIFFSDASGMRLTMGLRVELKAKSCDGYKIPDLVIAEPNTSKHAMFLEIKKEYSDVYKKDGSLVKSEHIEAQQKTIERLRELGYEADFGLGFNDSIQKIERYLNT